MADTPTTLVQVGLLILFVLPGFVYQITRQRLRGARPGEQDFKMFLLRSMLATLILDALYIAVAWPLLRPLVQPVKGAWFAGVLADPPGAAWLVLLGVLVVPVSVAWARWGLSLIRNPTARKIGPPTAWDHAFRHRRRSAWVRVRLKSGGWVGGWYNKRSYAAEYPSPPDLFIAQAWRMRPDGSFDHPIEGSAGLYVRMEDAEVLEFLEPQRKDPQ